MLFRETPSKNYLMFVVHIFASNQHLSWLHVVVVALQNIFAIKGGTSLADDRTLFVFAIFFVFVSHASNALRLPKN